MTAFTNADLAACAERELRQRRRVYARQVQLGKMTRLEAERETAMMSQIAQEYAAKAAAAPRENGRLL